ncbi:hypothetical protein BJ912DRAFT_1065913 [Pholiota molesta]|nr:hypothetical protein BJ912DRAFT_1065913 [Pholiota molesta]
MDNGVLDPHPCIRADRGESVSRSCGGLNQLESGPQVPFLIFRVHQPSHPNIVQETGQFPPLATFALPIFFSVSLKTVLSFVLDRGMTHPIHTVDRCHSASRSSSHPTQCPSAAMGGPTTGHLGELCARAGSQPLPFVSPLSLLRGHGTLGAVLRRLSSVEPPFGQFCMPFVVVIRNEEPEEMCCAGGAFMASSKICKLLRSFYLRDQCIILFLFVRSAGEQLGTAES